MNYTDRRTANAAAVLWRFGFQRGVMVGSRDQLGAPA